MKPPFIKVSGVFARPTCLNNVETLSLVPHLLLDEAGVYASCGSGESIGTKLISVAGNVNHPGVFEIPFGTTVREILYELAGGIQHDRKIRLIQFGGARERLRTTASSTRRTPTRTCARPASWSARAACSSSMSARACSTSCA